MMHAILIVSFLITPLILNYLCKKIKWLEKIGVVIFAYIIGIIIGNIGILHEKEYDIINQIVNVSILLALPQLLFSVNVKSWIKLAKPTFISMIIGLFSVIIVIVAGFFVFKHQINDSWKISGLLIGVYSGGTPNLASLKTALNVDNDIYILTHTYDMFISSLYLMFLMFAGRKVFSKFLPKFKMPKNGSLHSENNINGSIINNCLNLKVSFYKDFFISLFLAVGISGVGVALSKLPIINNQMVVLILTITTISLLISNFGFTKKIKNSYDFGMYFILVFSMAVASLADLEKFAYTSPILLGYIFMAIFGSLLIHLLLSAIFKIDTDTTIITSTALICSPPLVPVVAGAINNKNVLVSGITVGVLGYAIGNYLGVFIAYILKLYY